MRNNAEVISGREVVINSNVDIFLNIRTRWQLSPRFAFIHL